MNNRVVQCYWMLTMAVIGIVLVPTAKMFALASVIAGWCVFSLLRIYFPTA